MGVRYRWLSPELPFGSVGIRDRAYCFWSRHAVTAAWLLRFGLSAVGCGVGLWIAGLGESHELAVPEPGLDGLAMEYLFTLVCALAGALVAEAALWKGSCVGPSGETAVCFCVEYLVCLPWIRLPILVRPSATVCRALVPFVSVV